MQIERNFQVRTLRLDKSCHLAASMNLDKVGRGPAAQMMEIGLGQADIVAIKPAMTRGERRKIDIGKGCRHWRSEDMITIRAFACRDQVVDHGRHRPSIGWTKTFLRRQQNVDGRQALQSGQRRAVVLIGFSYWHGSVRNAVD